MTARSEQAEPFLRGVVYRSAGAVAYPRANPIDTSRLPGDVWKAASVPSGVRLELVGDAEAVDLVYRTTTGQLGYRGDAAGITFSVWRNGHLVCEEDAVLGDGITRLQLGDGRPDKPAVIYLPEGMQPVVSSITGVNGDIAPAPTLPRWIAYGDSVTQGWIASGPAQGWAAIAARKARLDLVNFGYASAGRGEIVSAEHIAEIDADVVSIAYGTMCWARTPHSTAMVEAGLHAFLDVVRQGHPTTPVVVMSPILRPDAEELANRLGASLSDIRATIESVVEQRMDTGDDLLALLGGADIITADHLADGIHPGDEGHKRLAIAAAKVLTAVTRPLEEPATAGDAISKSTADQMDSGDWSEDTGEQLGRTVSRPEAAASHDPTTELPRMTEFVTMETGGTDRVDGADADLSAELTAS